ncbi:hypothetical protein ACTNDG_12330 [Clostridium sp. HCP1S3_B4]|uniref:hypothetical protein n=1 Tax=unclassified Clostridium TaxID=2614128 RepID=UPI003F89325E
MEIEKLTRMNRGFEGKKMVAVEMSIDLFKRWNSILYDSIKFNILKNKKQVLFI